MDAVTPTLRTLLAAPELRLRLVSPGIEGALDRPLRWVHGTDLADPTPFLAEDLALLTTGSQFDREPVPAYVARLARRGVIGLGFGLGVHREDLPPALVEECGASGIPLFEVPYSTPFIAVARAHAEAVAAQAYARRTWALETQRALAIAALRGLDAALGELARRLTSAVAMFDAEGAPVHQHPAGAATAELASHAVALLARGATASETVEHDDASYTLFTLGSTGSLRGVIAVATAPLDPEARTVVTSVIAMAGLSLEQGEQLAQRARRLDAAVLTLLRDGAVDLARRLTALPPEPVVVAIAPDAANAPWWRRRAPWALVAAIDDGLAIVLPAGGRPRGERSARAMPAPPDAAGSAPSADSGEAGALLEGFAAASGTHIGASAPARYEAFADALQQARSAARSAPASAGPGVTHYSPGSGIRQALSGDEARLAAETALAPLRAADPGLEQALRVWLEHDARIEQAAAALGIHRHTLRARIAQASRLLGRDLSAFPARAELWALLQAAGD